MRFEEEEINKREKRENHAQHNTNINDARSLKVLKMRVSFFFKTLLLKKGVTFSSVFLRAFCGYTRLGFLSISQHLKEEKSRAN